MDLGEPPVLPSLRLPEPLVLPRPVLEVPRADLPSYKPLVVPPSDLRAPVGVKGTTPSDKPQPKPPTPPIPQVPKVPTVRIPTTEIDVPVPDGIVLTTAATTAVVSVAATLTATSLFKWLVTVMKPVFKTAWTKITKKKDSSNSSSSSGPPDS
tara:strand:- start:1312 stop:1770 length:459 start_codon:yes stop_codon:yes gene_type:complete